MRLKISSYCFQIVIRKLHEQVSGVGDPQPLSSNKKQLDIYPQMKITQRVQKYIQEVSTTSKKT